MIDVILRDEFLDVIKKELRSPLRELTFDRVPAPVYIDGFRAGSKRIDILAIALEAGIGNYRDNLIDKPAKGASHPDGGRHPDGGCRSKRSRGQSPRPRTGLGLHHHEPLALVSMLSNSPPGGEHIGLELEIQVADAAPIGPGLPIDLIEVAGTRCR